ncbi:hypothetical protein Tco_0896752, partial [Tanacetum coccineum]
AAAGGHDPVCVVLFMEVTGSGQQPIQSVKTSGFDKSFESDRMVFIYDVLAEFDAMNKGKQVLGHRFRGCYDMLRWSTDENKAGCFYCLYTIPADRSYFCSYCSVTAGLVIPAGRLTVHAACTFYPGYYLIPTDGFLLTHTVPADLLYTNFFGRFWFLLEQHFKDNLLGLCGDEDLMHLAEGEGFEFDVTCDHSMEPIGFEFHSRALLKGKQILSEVDKPKRRRVHGSRGSRSLHHY